MQKQRLEVHTPGSFPGALGTTLVSAVVALIPCPTLVAFSSSPAFNFLQTTGLSLAMERILTT